MPVAYLTSPLFEGLSCVAGFSTRKGGSSRGPHATLNLGHGLGDGRAQVAHNLELLLGAAGLAGRSVVTVNQVHGRAIFVADAPVHQGEALPEADAVVTATPGLAIAVRTADCCPSLVVDTRAGVVAAVHGGWRGTSLNILGAVLALLKAEFGARSEDLKVAIGPTIGFEAYEVGAEVRDAVLQGVPPGASGVAGLGAGGRWHVDLAEAHRLQALAAGVPIWNIHKLGRCTASEPDNFFSHRRDRGVTGRMLAFVALGASHD